MTTRYGPLYASFWEWDDSDYDPITTSPTPLTILEIESAEVIKKLGQMTRGRFTAPEQDNWEFFLQEGRLVSLYQYDGVLDDNREMGGFLMEKVRPALRADGKMGIEVSGLGREKLLTRYRHWAPIGDETTYVTTIATTVPAPWATTVDVGAPAGNDHIVVDDLGGAQVGDIIRIEMENSDIFVTKIVDIEPPGAPPETAVLESRLPYSSFAGRDVEFRRGRVTVASVDGMGAGLEIQILLDSTSIHQTVIADVDLENVQVLLRDGVPSQSTSGKQVTTYDYSAPATDDVTQIMAPAVTAGWELAFGGVYTGTENGTAHQPEGESVWELLTATAEQSGEFFRISELESGDTPRKKIRWFRTNDSSGMSLVLYATDFEANTATENVNLGVIHEIQREREHNVITRVYPVGADGRISLAYATDAALAEASSAGFAVGTDSGLYGKDYIQYTAGVTAHGVLSDVVRYGNLTLSDKGSVTELQAAADSMLRQAMTTILESQEREYWHVKAHTHRPLFPGQSVTLINTAMEPTQASATFYVLEVRESFEKGVILSNLTLSMEKQQRPTATVLLGRQLQSTKQAALRPTSAGTMVVGAVVGGGGGGTTDHGALTGLGDDDHPQYLRTDGTRTLTGNLAAAAAVTIDGVDISAHAANPAAHHNPVTVGNTGLSLATQDVSLALKTDPGLLISSGLGMGTPSTLTAATSNAVSGSNHSHAITATDNAKSPVSTLLKGTANGDLTLRYLIGDKVTTPEVDTASGDLTLDPASGKTVNDGNLEFTGARSITTSSGSLTLAPVSDLILDPASDAINVAASATLKTANFSSGFLGTGWGVTYAGAADFRSIYADELHVAAFIADTARVKVGAEYITPSMAIISRNFTIPAVSSTGTLYVEDAPGLDDTAVFADNDWLLLRIIDRPAGGLNVLNVWGQVTSYTNQTDGEQSWTFTTRSAGAAAVGEVARLGGVALDFGQSGDGWIWLTTLDATGSPYLGITTWQGSDPYTEGNRSHKLRLGNLQGVSGMREWGLQAGQNTANFIRFSDLRSEIHGSRLSLYAGDAAQLRVRACQVQHYRAVADISYLLPNADHTAEGVLSTGAAYYTEVDEDPGSPTTTNYIYNGVNQSGVVFMGLANPTWTGTTVRVNIRANIETTGFTNDTVKLYGQIFDSDETTPLTSEKLVYTATTDTTSTPNVQCDSVVTNATQAQWNAARLRLRWEYAISDSDEAIRLDPNVPSIAVGSPLPTGTSAGGSGLWAGLESGAYKFKMGGTSGTGARVEWDGTDLIIRAYDGASMIRFDSDGSSYFAGPMTLGTSGGIYQGTGTFASPTAGLKIWNSSGDGYVSTFESGAEQVRIFKDGISLGSESSAFARRNSITFAQTPSSTPFAGVYANYNNAANTATKVTNTGLYFIKNGTDGRAMLAGGSTYFVLDSSNDYALLSNADLYIKEGGAAVGYTTTPSLNRGQIASDLAGEHNFNSIVLQDTTDIAHGMTDVVGTGTYATLGKVTDGTSGGGLEIGGYTEGTIAWYGQAYGTTTNTTANGSGFGAFTFDAFLKSGAGGGAYAAGDNLFVVRNNGTARFLIQGDGDFFYDGTGAAYDDKDDVALLRGLSREKWGGTIQSVWDQFVTTNRRNLIDAGVLSEGGFINGPALNRLLTGSIWQLHERLSRLEAATGGQ